jgi:hypothetical protein
MAGSSRFHGEFITPSRIGRTLNAMTKYVVPGGIVVLGAVVCAAGIYVGETDDAPGAALVGLVLLVGAVVLGVQLARRSTKPLTSPAHRDGEG